MTRIPALPLTLAVLIALAGCGTVAPEAPALLTEAEIQARAASIGDPARGEAAARTVAWRAASLRARAAQLRRANVTSAEDLELLRRAAALQREQP